MEYDSIINAEGWIRMKVSSSSNFELVYAVIKNGVFLWFSDDSNQRPLGVVSLMNSKLNSTSNISNDGGYIYTFNAEDKDGTTKRIEVIFVNEYEVSLWQKLFTIHSESSSDMSGTVKDLIEKSVANYEEKISPATLEVHFKGQPYEINVSMDENPREVAEKFVESHSLRDDIKIQLEVGLLQSLLESCSHYESRQRKHVASIRRRLATVAVAERRALAAEAHAAHVAEQLLKVETSVETMTKNMSSIREKEQAKQVEIERLTNVLINKGKNPPADELLREIDVLRNNIKTLESELAVYQTGDQQNTISLRRELQAALKALKEARRQKVTKHKEFQEYKRTTERDLNELRRLANIQKVQSHSAHRHSSVDGIHMNQFFNSSPGASIGSPSSLASPNSPSKGKSASIAWGGSSSVLSTGQNSTKNRIEIEELTSKLEETQDSLAVALEGKLGVEDQLKVTEEHVTVLTSQLDLMNRNKQSWEYEKKELLDELKVLSESSVIQRLQKILIENQSLKEHIMRLRSDGHKKSMQFEEVRQSALKAVSMLSTLPHDDQTIQLLQNSIQSHVNANVNALATYNDISNTNNRNGSTMSDTAIESPSPSTGSNYNNNNMNNMNNINNNGNIEHSMGHSPMVAARTPWNLHDDLSDDLLSVVTNETVQLRIISGIFQRHCSENGSIMHSRFIRFAKEFLLTPQSSGASVNTLDDSCAPMLIAGDIDLIFKAAIKNAPADRKAPFGTGPRMFVRRSQTAAASNMLFHQFIEAISMIARKLFEDKVEARFGATLEFLPELQRNEACKALIMELMVLKLIPNASRLGLLPWPLFYTHHFYITACDSLESYRESILDIESVQQILSWYHTYVDVSNVNSNTNPNPNTNINHHNSNKNNNNISFISFKGIIRMGHELGIIPFLLKETQLFYLFEELHVWRRTRVRDLISIIPQNIVKFVQPELLEWTNMVSHQKSQNYYNYNGGNQASLTATSSGPTASPGFTTTIEPPTIKTLNIEAHQEVLGPASFIILIGVIANQAFPSDSKDIRLTRLIQWVIQGGNQ